MKRNTIVELISYLSNPLIDAPQSLLIALDEELSAYDEEVSDEIINKKVDHPNVPFKPTQGDEVHAVRQITPFRNGEAAEYERLRQESRAAQTWVPKNGEHHWSWMIQEDKAERFEWDFFSGNHAYWHMGNVHQTRELAEAWGRKFAKSFSASFERDEQNNEANKKTCVCRLN